MHRATKESELTTQSADGSMAKGTAVALGYHRRPPRRLDKMSLLMEVRHAFIGNSSLSTRVLDEQARVAERVMLL
jgi:hypothetical protein